MTDIVPELMDKIKSEFNRIVNSDKTIERIANRIRDGTTELADGHEYAQRLGEILSEVLQNELKADILPNETMYYNIADRTVRPMLERNHDLTNAAASEIQKIVDRLNGIGLNSILAQLPADRIDGLIDKLVEEGLEWLGEPIVNCTESFFDDFIKANADFRGSIGMNPIIERTASPGCCEWCAGLAGVYDYFDIEDGSDVYKRHEYCRCVVTYKNGMERQDVWSKKVWQSPESELERRKTIGL